MDERKVLAISGAVFAVFLALAAVFSGDFVVSSNFVFFGIIAVAVPYSLYRFFKFKKIRAYEEEFPNFLVFLMNCML